MFPKIIPGCLRSNLADHTEVRSTVCLGVVVEVFADFLRAEFGCSHVTGFQAYKWAKNGIEYANRQEAQTQASAATKSTNTLESATRGWFSILGVFAHLVMALVFKTSGGFEQSSQWVRFPYTPAYSNRKSFILNDLRFLISAKPKKVSDFVSDFRREVSEFAYADRRQGIQTTSEKRRWRRTNHDWEQRDTN